MRVRISFLALLGLCAPSLAQSPAPPSSDGGKVDVRLDELRYAATPRQAKDLDTLKLASAQRQRAESVSEKTNGLWQSWIVSICEGCGNTPPYKKTVGDDFANRKGRYVAGLEGKVVEPQASAPRKALPVRNWRSLYADLSTENISQIRRMPAR
ncbi:hypothetical protein [Methylobacterium sp. J-090]|uniref:hypothetical protein n=1 Tax=Methylobacterium sp. J-090 TaxID=2836666 RepID=UPI001FBBEF94|nr:hypothetical protein [Methylobacterium sp. J-090]MCJ2081868.1 hypothetical protein [Methylobacterium sp. J-090]